MSDYSSTYSKTTGQTIEASDFSTEFDAIETASATKYDDSTGTLVISQINDQNGNELVKCTTTASAVNELTIANGATGNGPTLSATGGDTNIGIGISAKGTGRVNVEGVDIWDNQVDADTITCNTTLSIPAGSIDTTELSSGEQMTSANVGSATASLGSTDIGAYIFARANDATNRAHGDTLAGTSLYYSGGADHVGANVGTGTWTCVGQGFNGAATLWKRTS